MYDGKTLWAIFRGIAGNPDDFDEWEFNLRDKIIRTTGIPAIVFSYKTNFLTVWKNRRLRAERAARVLKGFSDTDYRINIAAHSEGTVVATDSLRLLGWPRVENLHLVCGACDSDFERIGINRALKMESLGEVHCWIAGKDTAMKFERLVLGKLLFGIPERSEPLGLHGPRNVNQEFKANVCEHWGSPWDEYGHSDCWLPQNLNRTMLGFLNPPPRA